MNCGVASGLIGAAHDGELADEPACSMDEHIAGCAACSAELGELRSLGRELRREAPYHRAPASLRARIEARTGTASTAPPGMPIRVAPVRSARSRWLAIGALSGALATLGIVALADVALAWQGRDDLIHDAVAGHVRATLGHHLIEVASSDRHTVKPWLTARLDYAPRVEDHRDDGFPLQGARLDVLDGRPVAVLVYGYRLHTVDVFVRPRGPASLAPSHGAPELRSVRGFNVATASGTEMEWRAVSDLQADVLAAFVARLAHDDASPYAASR